MSLKTILLKNSSWNLASYFYLLVASLVSLPFMIRGLGADNYSRYVIMVAVTTLISTLDLGLPQALVRSLSSSILDKSAKLLDLRISLLVTVILALVAGLSTYYSIFVINNMPIFHLDVTALRLLAYPIGVLTTLTFLISLFGAVPQGRGDFAISSIRPFIAGTANTLLAASVALATGDLAQVLWVLVLGSGLTLFLLILYTVTHYSLRAVLPAFDKSSLKRLLSFGLPTFAGSFAPQLQANISKLFAGSYLSAQVISGLSIAQSLVFKGSGVFGQITSAFFPAATTLATAGDKVKLRRASRKLTILFFTLSAATLAGIYFAGKPLLSLWLGDTQLVGTAWPLLLAYLGFILVVSLVPAPAVVIAAYGKPGIVSLFSWIEVSIEIALAFVLIRMFAGLGLPLAALISQALVTPFFLHQYRKISA